MPDNRKLNIVDSYCRNKIVEKIKKVFESFALEGHLSGSLAKGNADNFSDVDVWLTFSDKNFPEILENRFEYYSQIGEIVHICEPPQNAPIDGVQSFVLYKTKIGLIPVDYYLCPQSTSITTTEGKNLFGDILLPIGEIKLNPQKKDVSDSYRIDFFISFIFNAIKKIIRKNKNALSTVFREYEYLSERYDIVIPPIANTENAFITLEKIIGNIKKIANEKQKKTLTEIQMFIMQIKKQYK